MKSKFPHHIPWKTSLIIILFIEVAWAAVLMRAYQKAPRVGFLVKDFNSYLVVWNTEEQGLQTHRAASVLDAVNFAKSELGLSVGRNPGLNHEMEYLTMVDRFGVRQVIWKVSQVNFMHQISFNRTSDADFFMGAFRMGAYSPSPYGHSILLLPNRLSR